MRARCPRPLKRDIFFYNSMFRSRIPSFTLLLLFYRDALCSLHSFLSRLPFATRLARWQTKPTVRGPYSIGPVDSVISEDSSLGKCWVMKGSVGRVTIRLPMKITVDGVSLEHASRMVTHESTSAPRDFEVSQLKVFVISSPPPPAPATLLIFPVNDSARRLGAKERSFPPACLHFLIRFLRGMRADAGRGAATEEHDIMYRGMASRSGACSVVCARAQGPEAGARQADVSGALYRMHRSQEYLHRQASRVGVYIGESKVIVPPARLSMQVYGLTNTGDRNPVRLTKGSYDLEGAPIQTFSVVS